MQAETQRDVTGTYHFQCISVMHQRFIGGILRWSVCFNAALQLPKTLIPEGPADMSKQILPSGCHTRTHLS